MVDSAAIIKDFIGNISRNAPQHTDITTLILSVFGIIISCFVLAIQYNQFRFTAGRFFIKHVLKTTEQYDEEKKCTYLYPSELCYTIINVGNKKRIIGKIKLRINDILIPLPLNLEKEILEPYDKINIPIPSSDIDNYINNNFNTEYRNDNRFIVWLIIEEDAGSRYASKKLIYLKKFLPSIEYD